MIEYLKLFIGFTPKAIMGTALFCIAAIIVPNTFMSRIGLLELRNNNIQGIWIFFAVSVCLLIARAMFTFTPVLKSKIVYWFSITSKRKLIKNTPGAVQTLIAIVKISNNLKEDSEEVGVPLPVNITDIKQQTNLEVDKIEYYRHLLSGAGFIEFGIGGISNASPDGLKFLYDNDLMKN